MEELKTLKDICKIYIEIGETEIVKTNELKQEAIKWIKDLFNKGTLGDLNSAQKHNENFARKSQIDWIKNFFNITEGDLKE